MMTTRKHIDEVLSIAKLHGYHDVQSVIWNVSGYTFIAALGMDGGAARELRDDTLHKIEDGTPQRKAFMGQLREWEFYNRVFHNRGNQQIDTT